MNEAEVQILKDKITKCDITVHIQQLGTQWIPQQSEDQKEISSAERSKLQNNSIKAEQQENQDQVDEVQLVVPDERLQELFDMVIEEADFLIDDKLREQLSEMTGPEQLSSKLEIIKKCLSIDTIEEMNIFIEELMEKCK